MHLPFRHRRKNIGSSVRKIGFDYNKQGRGTKNSGVGGYAFLPPLKRRTMSKTKPEDEIEFQEPSPELKKYMAKLEEERRNRRFCKIPHWLIDSGALGVMRPTTAKLLMVLARWAYFTTGIGRIGNRKIRKFKISSPSTYFRELVDLGGIRTWRRGWVRYYRIQFSPPADLEKRIQKMRQLKRKDIYPKKSVTYLRDAQTGKFIRKGDKYPKNTDVAHPKKTVPA